MIGKLSRLASLSWPERRVLLRAMMLLPLFWAGLRVLGLSRLHSWVARELVAAGRPVNDAQDVAACFAAFDGPLSPGSFSSP